MFPIDVIKKIRTIVKLGTVKAMKKIEEVTCIKFQEKSRNYHQELALYNGVPIII